MQECTTVALMMQFLSGKIISHAKNKIVAKWNWFGICSDNCIACILKWLSHPCLFRFLAWPVREGNIELLKILLPGCPNAAGTQEDNEPELLQFAEKACEITNNVAIVNFFLDHLTKINLRNKDKCVQAGFVSACGAGHEAVVKRLIEVSEEDGINLSMTIIPDIQIQGQIGLTETTFPGKLNIVKILLGASRDKKVDLTHKNSFDLEIIEYLTEAMRIKVKEE